MATIEYTFTCEHPACGQARTKPWRQSSERRPRFCSLACWYATRRLRPFMWRRYTFTEAQDRQIREACRKHGRLKALWLTGLFGETPYPVLKYHARALGVIRTQSDEIWTPEEDVLLGEWGERLCLDRIARKFHANGFHRSAGAIRERLYALGMSTRQGEWTLDEIAKGLDIDAHTVKRWVDRGYLKATPTAGPDKPRWYVSSANMKRFLIAYPYLAAHGDMRLVWVITMLSSQAALDRAAVGG